MANPLTPAERQAVSDWLDAFQNLKTASGALMTICKKYSTTHGIAADLLTVLQLMKDTVGSSETAAIITRAKNA